MGVSLTMVLHIIGVEVGFIKLLIGHIALCLPFSTIIIYNYMKSIDYNIINAAYDLGASDYNILKKYFQHIKPQLIAKE